MALRLVIHGASGRMGQRLLALGSKDQDLQIVAALEREGHPSLGKDAGALAGLGSLGVPLTSELQTDPDVIIDFSVPESTDELLRLCGQRGIALVLATTGHSDEQKRLVRETSQKIPILWAPSMSLAVNLAMKLCQTAGATLKSHSGGVDVEIIERHHRFKEDSPSGTALRFGELIAGAMGQTRHVHGREGRPGVRPRDEIGYHAVRVGDNPGEHTIVFGLLGESLELTVRATNRDCYAVGALTAAKWLAGRPAGLYSMNDVLGL